jgi:hypothetical protein
MDLESIFNTNSGGAARREENGEGP